MLIKRLGNFLLTIYVAIFEWIPTTIGIRLRYIAYKPLFKKSGRFSIHAGVTILGFDQIELGDNVTIMKNSYLYAHEGGSLKIGDHSAFNTNVQLGASGGLIVIGNYCLVGPNCVLRAANHNFDRTDIPMKNQGHTYGEILIEDDVWISSNSVVTANTTIGRGSVVAAGSVVNKDVEPLSIVRGVPAKFVARRRIYEG